MGANKSTCYMQVADPEGYKSQSMHWPDLPVAVELRSAIHCDLCSNETVSASYRAIWVV